MGNKLFFLSASFYKLISIKLPFFLIRPQWWMNRRERLKRFKTVALCDDWLLLMSNLASTSSFHRCCSLISIMPLTCISAYVWNIFVNWFCKISSTWKKGTKREEEKGWGKSGGVRIWQYYSFMIFRRLLFKNEKGLREERIGVFKAIFNLFIHFTSIFLDIELLFK